MMYGGETPTDGSDGRSTRSNSLRKRSNDSNRKSSGASSRGIRAKSMSPRKASKAADHATTSPCKTGVSNRGSRSKGRVSFAESTSTSPSQNPVSPVYTPPPAHRRSTNPFTGEPLEPSNTPNEPSDDPSELPRPSTRPFSSIHDSPRTIQFAQIARSAQINPSPQISPNTVAPPNSHRSSLTSPSGFPIYSSAFPTKEALMRRPSFNPFAPVRDDVHHPSLPAIPVSSPIPGIPPRRFSERPPDSGTQAEYPQRTDTHRKSSNFFLTPPEESMSEIPKGLGLMSPPPPPAGPPPETPPVPPPPAEEPMTKSASSEMVTKIEQVSPSKELGTGKALSVMKRRDSRESSGSSELSWPRTPETPLSLKHTVLSAVPKLSKSPKQKKVALKTQIKRSTKTTTESQPEPKSRHFTNQKRPARILTSKDAPGRNTRSAAMERRRKGQRAMVKGTRFGYEELEFVEMEARRVRGVRRERKKEVKKGEAECGM